MPGFEVLYQAAALCLMFPDDDFRARLPLLRESRPAAEGVRRPRGGHPTA
ncbi:hypothetical protein GCM10011428_84440 [Streptomyces violaceus]